ncbi:MAG: LarC family nickel insertion protein [Candidatus Adiutrix sp.]|nr:LarC family nickel insertion protein [Candidatus Adiutrix sp.]
MTAEDIKRRHAHGDDNHGRRHEPDDVEATPKNGAILVIRPNTGISGDMMAAGLAVVTGTQPNDFDDILAKMNLGRLAGRIRLQEKLVDQIKGHSLTVDLPCEHEHRGLSDVRALFEESALGETAKMLAIKTFAVLAEAEGAVHGLAPEMVHFHEVGALDSIVDVGLAAALLERLAPERICCGPLPICDGAIKCRHGLMPSPAPAVMELMRNVAVTGFNSYGETVTPTGLAILKAAEAEFGPWPAMRITRHALVYGSRYFENVPNGTLFAVGEEA